MTKAMRIHSHGGPEVFVWEDVDVAAPAADEVQIRHTAIGINYSDVNVRRGGFYLKHQPQMPLILGNEAAGIVEAVGAGVSGVKVGDRVCYAGMRGEFFEDTGAYVELRNVPAERVVPIPEGVSDRQAAAMMVKGFTASLIVNRICTPKAGETILVHAAASGVGIILAQWAKHLGATVIGTAGSQEKADIARAHGVDHVILYRETDFVEAVKALTGEGVQTVYDGVGKDTFIKSLQCVRPFGFAVNYGNASGHVPPLELLLLAPKSITVARPGLSSYIRNEQVMRTAAAELFDLVARGAIRIDVARTYALKDAAAAHREIEERGQAGSLLLIP